MAVGKRMGATEKECAVHPSKKAKIVFPLGNIEQSMNTIKNEWQNIHADKLKLLDHICKLEHFAQTCCKQ